MSAAELVRPRPAARWTTYRAAGGGNILGGIVLTYLSVIVLLPIAAIVWRSAGGGVETFRTAVTAPDALAALQFTLIASLAVMAINAAAGTLLAWVLVRDSFPGKGLVNAVIDLPFALPTIVAGATLLTLYGPNSPLGINAAYTRAGVVMALLFVTLPFVVRAVQPVLQELERDVEEAAVSLGASPVAVFRRIILPSLRPAILSGVALAFARSMGEFGSVVLLSGNIPFRTEVASVNIYNHVETGNLAAAAALSVVLLVISLLVLLVISALERWGRKYDG
jgi:sulfate transport system permease protein